MQIDTVSSPDMPGLVELGISPDSVEAILLEMLPISGRKKPFGNPLNGCGMQRRKLRQLP
jgi:hypothetical protein